MQNTLGLSGFFGGRFASLSLGWVPWAAVLVAGCGSTAQKPPAHPEAQESAAEVELDSLRASMADREEQLQELESRLALARAEAAELRASSQDHRAVAQTVRIGGRGDAPQRAPSSDDWVEPWEEGVWSEEALTAVQVPEEEPPKEPGPRPVLRLRGTPQAPAWDAASMPPITSLPPIPARAPLRLPVASLPAVLPGAPRASPGLVAGAAASHPQGSSAATAYRMALRSLRDGRFQAAQASFESFLRSHPQHPYAASATYWRGEALYAQRAYGAAKVAFQAVVQRYPRARKTPDALLKMSYCEMRLGNRVLALQLMERLRRDYPASVAARSAGPDGLAQ